MELLSEKTIQTLARSLSRDANIDYGFAEANTVYGKLGIKCWVCKGDTKVEKPQPQPAAAAN